MRIATLIAALAASGLAADDPKLADGKKAFQGTWTIVSLEHGGKKADEPVTAGTVVFKGDKYVIKAGDKTVEEGTFQVDAAKTPNRIEVTVKAGEDKGKKWHGVYELEGDTLRAVVGPVDKDPPKSLANPAPGTRGFTLKRQKPAKP
jgi:uncharacterized protein (TIGR03067 family)